MALSSFAPIFRARHMREAFSWEKPRAPFRRPTCQIRFGEPFGRDVIEMWVGLQMEESHHSWRGHTHRNTHGAANQLEQDQQWLVDTNPTMQQHRPKGPTNNEFHFQGATGEQKRKNESTIGREIEGTPSCSLCFTLSLAETWAPTVEQTPAPVGM